MLNIINTSNLFYLKYLVSNKTQLIYTQLYNMSKNIYYKNLFTLISKLLLKIYCSFYNNDYTSEKNYRKTPCPVSPKQQQFCKIHEGNGQGVQILVTILTKNEWKYLCYDDY